MNWPFDMIFSSSLPMAMVYSVTFFVLFITLFSLGINLYDWIITVRNNIRDGWFQLSYPNSKDKIVRIKFQIYVVGYPSGEVFYVDEKKIKKLKRKKIIYWSGDVGCYIFKDEDSDEVKKITAPDVIFRYETLKENDYFNAT